MRLLAPLAVLALSVTPAFASDDTIAVTPKQTSEEASPPATDTTGLPIEIHGELAAMVASDGSKAVAGTVVIPLGDKGELGLAFETGRYGAGTGTGPYGWGAPGPFAGPSPMGTPADCGSTRSTVIPSVPSCDMKQ